MLEIRSIEKMTEDSGRQQIWALCPIGASAIVTLLFAWCVVYGVWNIDSNANGHTPALVLAIRMFGILFIGMAAVVMGVITFVAVQRHRGWRKETTCSVRGVRPSASTKDLVNPYAPPTTEETQE